MGFTHKDERARAIRKLRFVKTFSKKLRREATPSEAQLWEKIKDRALGVEFLREKHVHGYTPDFYCSELRLAVEVEGGIHRLAVNKIHDRRKAKTLAAYGIKIIRFTNTDVNQRLRDVLWQIENAIATQTASVDIVSSHEQDAYAEQEAWVRQHKKAKNGEPKQI